MEGHKLTIRFDIRSTAKHALDMRQLGRSLIGIERVISIGLYGLDTGKVPRPAERLPLRVSAAEPRPGSVVFDPVISVIPATMPFLHDVLVAGGADIVWRWISGLFLRMGGRTSESERLIRGVKDVVDRVNERQHVERMTVEENRHQEQVKAEANRHEERMAELAAQRERDKGLQHIIDRLIPSATEAVCPIKQSQDRILFTRGESATIIDFATARAIRSQKRYQWGESRDYVIQIDGFTHHNRQLKITHPEDQRRFITAVVVDHEFEKKPNVYTMAAMNHEQLIVRARPQFRNGEIQKLFIESARHLS